MPFADSGGKVSHNVSDPRAGRPSVGLLDPELGIVRASALLGGIVAADASSGNFRAVSDAGSVLRGSECPQPEGSWLSG